MRREFIKIAMAASVALAFVFGCADFERDHPDDEGGNNYGGRPPIPHGSSSSQEGKYDSYMLFAHVYPYDGGTFSISGNNGLSGGGYSDGLAGYSASSEYGTTFTLTAKPNPRYRFVKWSGDYSSTDATISVTIYGNTNLTAEFESTDTEAYSSSSADETFWYLYVGEGSVGNAMDSNGNYIVVIKDDDGKPIAKIQNFNGIYSGIGVTGTGKTEVSLDVSNCSEGYFYRYKGIEHDFSARLRTVADYDYHKKNFASSDEWQTAFVKFSELQQGGWGNKVQFDAGKIEGFSWDIAYGDGAYKSGSLSVADFQCL